ncbi:MAG: fibronectin type III domain-containing protein, partial [Nitrospirota bacterium]|nr:fibronectin type III domain-containing protein [Nitrospirota bacterium]
VGYRVYVTMMSPTPMHYVFDAGTETQLKTDLPIGESYSFTVVAYNGAGQSPPSSIFEFALF